MEYTKSLQEELDKLAADAIAMYIVGDMNIHHKRWLRPALGAKFGRRPGAPRHMCAT